MHPVRRQIDRHAARLRRERTDAQDTFWQAVRDRQIDGSKFRFQHSPWPYVADFVCLDAVLIVELGGGQQDEGVDRERTASLESSGFQVLRFWHDDTLTNLDGAVTVVHATLIDRTRTKALPNPSREGGRG